ncbi:MAG: asparagine synthase (glutamine-hydrolyzing), partial [Saprospiraceae bacterium]
YFFENNLALGNRRLAILDLSDKGHQPMNYKELTITYNGALYNYLEIKNSLIQKGYFFQTNTDTEVILVAYKEWGNDCVYQFNGMWAFAIYDRDHQTLFCSRDRFGIKPFYYIWQEDTLTFASEIKAFKPLPFWKPTLNPTIAADYLFKGLQNHTDQTIYKNVQQLPGGHHLLFDLKTHQYTIEKYYNIEKIKINKSLSFEEAATQFRVLLNDAIQLHSRSDVKVGSALSGGLDSSSIVALQYKMLGVQKHHLEVVSYASETPEFDESPYVEELVKKYPVKVHKTSSTFEETFSKIDEVIRAHDEPLLSASLIAQYFVFKTAKANDLKVMLDGQGADELLAGYGTYYLPFLKEIGLGRIFKLAQEVWGLLGKHQIKSGKKMSFFKKAADLGQYLNLPAAKVPPITKGFQSYSNYMLQKGILPALLQFEDRNSMAHSVESRVPFLDYRFVEFCMSLPAGFKIREGVRKAILRKAMSDLLPDKILMRYDKMGFSTPQEYWMSENQEVILESIQSSVSKYPVLFKKELIPFAKKILAKKQTEHYSFLWRVMTFGRWMELYKVNYQ